MGGFRLAFQCFRTLISSNRPCLPQHTMGGWEYPTCLSVEQQELPISSLQWRFRDVSGSRIERRTASKKEKYAQNVPWFWICAAKRYCKNAGSRTEKLNLLSVGRRYFILFVLFRRMFAFRYGKHHAAKLHEKQRKTANWGEISKLPFSLSPMPSSDTHLKLVYPSPLCQIALELGV